LTRVPLLVRNAAILRHMKAERREVEDVRRTSVKGQTRVYAHRADGYTLVSPGVLADCKEMTSTTTGKFYGKDCPITGATGRDAHSGKQFDASMGEFALKKGDKKVGTAKRTAFADGKTLTVSNTVTDAMAAATTPTQVLERK